MDDRERHIDDSANLTELLYDVFLMNFPFLYLFSQYMNSFVIYRCFRWSETLKFSGWHDLHIIIIVWMALILSSLIFVIFFEQKIYFALNLLSAIITEYIWEVFSVFLLIIQQLTFILTFIQY